MKALHRLTQLQLTLLDPIWRCGEATVREVHATQEDSLGLALKTVGTVLRRLEDQEVLEHRRDGRQFVYRARVSREEVRAAALAATTDTLFNGSVAELVVHALGTDSVGDRERARIRRALDDMEA